MTYVPPISATLAAAISHCVSQALQCSDPAERLDYELRIDHLLRGDAVACGCGAVHEWCELESIGVCELDVALEMRNCPRCGSTLIRQLTRPSAYQEADATIPAATSGSVLRPSPHVSTGEERADDL